MSLTPWKLRSSLTRCLAQLARSSRFHRCRSESPRQSLWTLEWIPNEFIPIADKKQMLDFDQWGKDYQAQFKNPNTIYQFTQTHNIKNYLILAAAVLGIVLLYFGATGGKEETCRPSLFTEEEPSSVTSQQRWRTLALWIPRTERSPRQPPRSGLHGGRVNGLK